MFNKIFLLGIFLMPTLALTAMQQQFFSPGEQKFISHLKKAVKEKNFKHYFALIETLPVKEKAQFVDLILNDSKTAIHFASEHGDTEAVRKLLELGAYVNDSDKDHMTPFLYAAKNGNPATLALLLEKGAHKTAYDDRGMTALHWAAAGNHTTAITALVRQYGFGINTAPTAITERMEGNTPLHSAAAHGHVEAINTLIALGADKDSVNINGATALHEAARNGKTAAVIKLIRDHGFDPNAVDIAIDGEGNTPLFYAADEKGNLETFHALIECGARIDESSSRRNLSILHYAASRNNPAVIISLIRDHGLNPNIETLFGSTPLGCAIANQACVAVTTLVGAGAQLTDRERDAYIFHRFSCLKQLKTSANQQMMIEGLARGSLALCDPNVTDSIDRATPLITAATYCCSGCIKLLIRDPRTNPNVQDRYGNTALHYSILYWQNSKSREICSRLLNLRKTNVGIKDGNEKTARLPLDAMLSKRSESCEETLRAFLRLFELRKMHVQAYLSLKHARCSEQCSEEKCAHTCHNFLPICTLKL